MPPAQPPTDRVLAARRAVGDRIRDARLHANLTQESVALTADISRHSLNRIEHGYGSPLLDTLVRIADAIGVPLADLVREE
ncbi:helix-turn-helix domain-containing protein [Streptomyces sp. sk2.1]|uniref:helix-turn-helix domain-containing protein n=1 Tax=Streptomyces sp. sk2.1 TaxID=2478959 RepID=UPI0011E63F9D|nr:XRE family transcriptional regulator [Streptomyces sp. sk2.1]